MSSSKFHQHTAGIQVRNTGSPLKNLPEFSDGTPTCKKMNIVKKSVTSMPSISDNYDNDQDMTGKDILFTVSNNNVSPIHPTLTPTNSSGFSSTIIFSNAKLTIMSTNVQLEGTLMQSSSDLSLSSPSNLFSSTLTTPNDIKNLPDKKDVKKKKPCKSRYEICSVI